MKTKYIAKDGSAVVEDASIRLRATAYPNGSGKIESTSPFGESSVLTNADAADDLYAEAADFLFEHQNL
jgi:hypothetical protein